MDDQEIISTIDRLVAEEHDLRRQHEAEPLGESDATRLEALEVSLDRCWDLLRQRRALRRVGGDPDEAEVRDPNVVEQYRQ